MKGHSRGMLGEGPDVTKARGGMSGEQSAAPVWLRQSVGVAGMGWGRRNGVGGPFPTQSPKRCEEWSGLNPRTEGESGGF